MANKLRETIFLICQEVDPNLGISADKATEAILQAVRDVVPEAQKDYNGKELSTDFDNYEAGYNQCRADILKELGGGE